MILKYHPNYNDILNFLRNNINYLTYEELIEEVKLYYKYEFSCKETLIYHLKANEIFKNKDTPRYRVKNIKGLRKAFEKNLFRMEKLSGRT